VNLKTKSTDNPRRKRLYFQKVRSRKLPDKLSRDYSNYVSISETLKTIRRREKPAVIIVNAAKTGSRALSARAALSRYPVPVCPVHISDRTVYLDASLDGRGVGEMRGHSAREAYEELKKTCHIAAKECAVVRRQCMEHGGASREDA
jgi:hypothetical protein